MAVECPWPYLELYDFKDHILIAILTLHCHDLILIHLTCVHLNLQQMHINEQEESVPPIDKAKEKVMEEK